MEVIFEKSLEDHFVFKIRLICYSEVTLRKRNVTLNDFTKILQCSKKEIKDVILRNGGKVTKDERTIYFIRKKNLNKFVSDFEEHFAGVFVMNKLERNEMESIKFDSSRVDAFKWFCTFMMIANFMTASSLLFWLVNTLYNLIN